MRSLKLLPIPLLALLPHALQAHHGSVTNSLLYQPEMLELQGEIVEVFWRNPHTRAKLRVVDESGAETDWELEFGPNPRRLENMGIEPRHLLGNVRVAGHVARNNPHSLGLLHILMPDGREFVQGAGREMRWSNDRLVEQPERIDPARAAEEELAADGIFRSWDTHSGPWFAGALLELAYTQRGAELNAAYDSLTDNRQLHCEHGMPDAMFDPRPMGIFREGDDIRIQLVQYDVRRLIHMGEPDPNPEPSNVGYSVGRWEGDTLVVATTHVDWPYYSDHGTPQSDQARYDERFWVVEEEGEPVLHYAITITDPVVFPEPLHFETTRTPLPGYEFRPYNCTAEWADFAQSDSGATVGETVQ